MQEASTTAVLLNLGGPDSLETVEPFLRNLFADPDIFKIPGGTRARKLLASFIIARRLDRVKASYARIGGASPLARLMAELGARIEAEFCGTVRVVSAMRYWHPLTAETLGSIEARQKVVFVSLYPHACVATTGSAFREIERVMADSPKTFARTARVESYSEHPEFVTAWVEMIAAEFAARPFEPSTTRLVFSAHGLPLKMARSGDPYEGQIAASVARIVEALPAHLRVEHQIAYQSRVGPVRWLAPNVCDVVRSLPAQGVKTLVVVPISFTIENLETLFELDIELRELAESCGLHDFRRVATPGGNVHFARALAGLIREHI
jgi:ferrochelatase